MCRDGSANINNTCERFAEQVLRWFGESLKGIGFIRRTLLIQNHAANSQNI